MPPLCGPISWIRQPDPLYRKPHPDRSSYTVESNGIDQVRAQRLGTKRPSYAYKLPSQIPEASFIPFHHQQGGATSISANRPFVDETTPRK